MSRVRPRRSRCVDDHVPRFDFMGTLSGRFPDLDWTAAFDDVTTTAEKDSMWGANGGAEVAYLLTRYFGVGMPLRYSRASHSTVNHFAAVADEWDFTWRADDVPTTVKMTHGGMHWNGGVTFRF